MKSKKEIIWKPDKNLLKGRPKKHGVGSHGAIGFVTKQGLVCCECYEEIKV